MKPSDRVNRIQEQQPAGATILEVHWENALIEYDEGGQGWWPLDSLNVIDDSNWPAFKALALSHPVVNAAIAAAIPTAPAAALALPASLLRAEQGATADFAACWSAVVDAASINTETLNQLVAAAQVYNLPQSFIDAILPQPK